MEQERTLDQMALFEVGSGEAPPPAPAAEMPGKVRQRTPRKASASPVASKCTPQQKRVGGSRSGLVPEGDVRLTANIREDLHLRLKIAAARQRTTIGELIEELVERHF